MSKMILAGALVAFVLLALPFAASADSGHGEAAQKAAEGAHSGGPEGHRGSMAESADLNGAWMELMAARNAIAGDVESGALGDVHEKAEPLPGLVVALLEKSDELDANKRTRVEGAAKQVARVADALHAAADGGDAARTRKELSRLDGLLELIRAQYPAGALDVGMKGHEDHSAAPGPAGGAHAYGLDAPGTYPVLCTNPGHTEGGRVGQRVARAGPSLARL